MPSSLITTLRSNLPADIDAHDWLDVGRQCNLLHALAAVPDPCDRRGVRYRLNSLLAVAVCAVLAGAATFAAIADWVADLDPAARRRLGFAGPIPAGSTVWRFLDAAIPGCDLQARYRGVGVTAPRRLTRCFHRCGDPRVLHGPCPTRRRAR
jgi:DDE_Tnp_1-associated